MEATAVFKLLLVAAGFSLRGCGEFSVFSVQFSENAPGPSEN
jgi:hypothetical protein